MKRKKSTHKNEQEKNCSSPYSSTVKTNIWNGWYVTSQWTLEFQY